MLNASVSQSEDPFYLKFLNIIRDRKPTQEEIELYLKDCVFNEDQIKGALDENITILCTHRRDVDMYNIMMISKCFWLKDVHDFLIDSNAFGVEELGEWINDTKFNQLKKVAVGARVMVL